MIKETMLLLYFLCLSGYDLSVNGYIDLFLT